jgi:very-short-patch-repair endonuclease
MDRWGAPVCTKCQNDFKIRGASKTAIRLYLQLCLRGIKAKLEKWDGFKSIDIAIPKHRLNIEVDGGNHHSAKQALTDLHRTYYSFIKGYYTIRIPNSLVDESLEDAVNVIAKFVEAKNKQLRKRN